jgi:cytoskeletal protein RodZ
VRPEPIQAPLPAPEAPKVEKKEEPKVEIKPTPEVLPPQTEAPKTNIGKTMILSESAYVRKLPSDEANVTKMWFFDKNEEVVIISQSDGDWVEVKNNMGRKGFIKLEKLKEKN